MLGWASLLKQRSSDAAVQKPADVICRNALAQAKLLGDILDMSRVIAGRLRVNPKPLDLFPIVREVIDTVRALAEAKAIDISFEPRMDDCRLVADSERMQQVVAPAFERD